MSAKTQNQTVNDGLHPGPIAGNAGGSLFARATRLVLQWSERARQRRHLSALTPSELDDVGISWEAASAEAAKPFWRA